MGAGQQSNSKGNGASKRMSNEKLKAKRVRCKANSAARKARHRAENDARHAVNVARGMTGHEIKRQERLERRAAEREAAA